MTQPGAERLALSVEDLAARANADSVDQPAEASTLQAAVLGARLRGWPDNDGAR